MAFCIYTMSTSSFLSLFGTESSSTQGGCDEAVSSSSSAVDPKQLWLSEEELQNFFKEIERRSQVSQEPVSVDEIYEYENGIKCTQETLLKPVNLDYLIEAGPINGDAPPPQISKIPCVLEPVLSRLSKKSGK